MSHQWTRKGVIFDPRGRFEWMHSHAQMPIAMHLAGDRYRVFFSPRTSEQRAQIAWFEIDINNPDEVLAISEDPVMVPGALGYFDDHGVCASAFVERDGQVWMYFIGYSPGQRRPLFYTAIGLAVSDDGGRTFRRVSDAPIMQRNEHDPWMCSGPMVLVEDDLFRMWYISGVRWEEVPSEPHGLKSYYHIKYAESDNGVDWRREGHVALPLQDPEHCICRPCIYKKDGLYHAWYSNVHGSAYAYRIGWSTSQDGLRWERRDSEAGMTPVEGEFDSGAQAYPWVVEHGDKRYMFYNGNQLGELGIGLAVSDI